MDKVELLWKFYEEQRDSAEKHDQQRTSITSFSIAFSGVMLAIISKTSDYYISLLMAIFISILGLYGVLIVRKLHERAEYYRAKARVTLNIIDKDYAYIFFQIIEQANVKHKTNFKLTHKWKLHWTLATIHILIFLLGIILIFIILLKQ